MPEFSVACLWGREARRHRRRVWVYEGLGDCNRGADETDRKPERAWSLRSGYCACCFFHPHLHCVVPGGGLSPDGQRWIACRPGFFLPVRVLSKLFRRLFLDSLQKAFDAGQLHFFGPLEERSQRLAFARHLATLKKWVVYAKRPFAGPQQVLDYVGRYTHRVALSNHRLLAMENDQVSFQWKDYRAGDSLKVMTLLSEEFIRRFLLHVLPDGFQRIRYYGFLGNRYRQTKLAQCRRLLGMPSSTQQITPSPPPEDYRDRYEELTGHSLWQCRQCPQGRMVVVQQWSRLLDTSAVRVDSS